MRGDCKKPRESNSWKTKGAKQSFSCYSPEQRRGIWNLRPVNLEESWASHPNPRGLFFKNEFYGRRRLKETHHSQVHGVLQSQGEQLGTRMPAEGKPPALAEVPYIEGPLWRHCNAKHHYRITGDTRNRNMAGGQGKVSQCKPALLCPECWS